MEGRKEGRREGRREGLGKMEAEREGGREGSACIGREEDRSTSPRESCAPCSRWWMPPTGTASSTGYQCSRSSTTTDL